MVNKDFWKNKKVLITGNTGFKGSWCHLVLKELGADVLGFSRDILTEPSTYNEIHKELNLQTVFGDITDSDKLKRTISDYKPEIVIHMAAQAIVKKSYSDPFDTFNTNVIGSLNVMEACKNEESVCVLINVTSDKCYENKELNKPFKEDDPLGGSDIYSASKACSEILAHSYNESFLASTNCNLMIASVRAGNVIGGGDWSDQRIIPDIIRSIKSSDLVIRNPDAIRPWQHVLDPIHGYLLLAMNIYLEKNRNLLGGWNFGPEQESAKSVKWVLDETSKYLSNFTYIYSKELLFKESHYLRLDSSKAKNLLGWKPVWDVDTSLRKTIEWYVNRELNKESSATLMVEDIHNFWKC